MDTSCKQRNKLEEKVTIEKHFKWVIGWLHNITIMYILWEIILYRKNVKQIRNMLALRRKLCA